MQVASIENSRCAEGVPDRNSSSGARARSSRTGCGTAIALIEWSGQNLPTESDLDPSRTDGRGQFSPAASRPAFVCAACPRMPKTEGEAQARLHLTLHARRAGRQCGAPFDAADPGCSRSRASFLAVPSELSIPTPTAGHRDAIDGRPGSLPFGSIA
jgi:hypothetical protein